MNAPLSNSELQLLRASLEERLKALNVEIQSEREAADEGRISQYAGEVHDRGEESNVGAAADVSAAVIGRHQVELAATRDALTRMDEGRYGECVTCGAGIGLERLRAYPSANRCVGCQSVAEQHG